jgi:hypothetical protein
MLVMFLLNRSRLDASYDKLKALRAEEARLAAAASSAHSAASSGVDEERGLRARVEELRRKQVSQAGVMCPCMFECLFVCVWALMIQTMSKGYVIVACQCTNLPKTCQCC